MKKVELIPMFHEVASYVNESQFEPGESAYECGFFAVALNHYAGKPGEKPTGTGEQVDEWADIWYSHCDGADTSKNTNGMTLWQLYYVLSRAGLHYQGYVPFDKTNVKEWVKAWIRLGYPVIVAVDEKTVYDLELGDKVPYSWKPTGSHIITVSGLDGENFLVRDPASIAPSGVRPGPRIVDGSRLSIISATAVFLSWLPRLQGGFNPLIDGIPVPVLTEKKPVTTYTVKEGDDLWGIAESHNISFAQLLSKNIAILTTVAKEHGREDSDNGGYIYPGTEILL
jgi:LysM repeat protein